MLASDESGIRIRKVGPSAPVPSAKTHQDLPDPPHPLFNLFD
jgi:hypothetical protein